MNSRDTPTQRAKDNAVEIASTLVVGLGLAALFLGVGNFWVIFALGFLVVVPLVALLFGDEDDRSEWWDDWWGDDDWLDDWWGSSTTDEAEASTEADAEPSEDSLSIIRRRYARGELTDAQFERKLERLLETETLEDLEDRKRARELLDEQE
ncbi:MULTISPECIES: SHOCT domain-containing protein [Halococcus]|uniref:SHOCT domain-containing protein n=1 Tax=Halococcus TaxID=2249 RepID=UPI000E724A81|nr:MULTISPECIES: SHOCT domain-containing protein [Halococcus]RJT03162.1 SHOCT domain-containing protein [Halococcus sp. IIIV-5B]